MVVIFLEREPTLAFYVSPQKNARIADRYSLSCLIFLIY